MFAACLPFPNNVIYGKCATSNWLIALKCKSTRSGWCVLKYWKFDITILCQMEVVCCISLEVEAEVTTSLLT